MADDNNTPRRRRRRLTRAGWGAKARVWSDLWEQEGDAPLRRLTRAEAASFEAQIWADAAYLNNKIREDTLREELGIIRKRLRVEIRRRRQAGKIVLQKGERGRTGLITLARELHAWLKINPDTANLVRDQGDRITDGWIREQLRDELRR